jgi:hypothetical protein
MAGGFIPRDARKCALLGMRSETLMVRAATPRVSNHEAIRVAFPEGFLKSSLGSQPVTHPVGSLDVRRPAALVSGRGRDPTSASTAPHNHTRQIVPGAPAASGWSARLLTSVVPHQMLTLTK